MWRRRHVHARSAVHVWDDSESKMGSVHEYVLIGQGGEGTTGHTPEYTPVPDTGSGKRKLKRISGTVVKEEV